MRLAILSVLLGVAAVLELLLLPRIVFHQAGGWGEPETIYPYVIAWAAVPFVWSAALLVAIMARRLASARVTTPFVVVALVGPLLAYIALAQYGHTTSMFMVIGLGIQCIALLVATVRAFMPPNPPVNADARDVPAHACDRAARAGYRERYSA